MAALRPRLHLGCLLGALLAAGCTWFDGLSQHKETPTTPAPDAGMDASDGDGGEDAGMRLDSGADSGRMDADADLAMDAGSDADVDPDADVGPVVDAGEDGGDPPTVYPPLPIDLTWHPESRRIAVTDDSPEPRVQPRAWLLVHGTQAAPRRLVTRLLDGTERNWWDIGVWSIDSPPAAVSYMDESMRHQQRVMFVRAGELGMVGFDGNAFVPLESHAAVDRYQFEQGGIGAIAMQDEIRGGQLIVAVARAARSGTSGYFCALDKSDVNGGLWRAHCSGDATLSSTTDIVATKARSQPCFFARSTSQGLLLISRQPDDTYLSFGVATPESLPLGASLAVYEGSDPNLAELIVVTADGRAWHGSVDPDDLSATRWEQLPALPGDATISVGEAAISAISLETVEGADAYRGPTVFARDEDGRVYYTSTVPKDAEHTWLETWTPQPQLPREEKVLALGALAPAVMIESDDNLITAPRSLQVVGGRSATTLQDFVESEHGSDASDHVRPTAEQRVTIASITGAEVSVASAADDALAAIAVRGSEAPFSVFLAGSEDNASSWHRVREPLASRPNVEDGVPASTLYPTAAYGGGLMHVVALEWDLPLDCSAPATRAQRIVYRRAESTQALAELAEGDLDHFVLASSSSGAYDRPAFAVTEGAEGATAHALFNDHEQGVVRYWRVSKSESRAQPAEAIDPEHFPLGWLDLIVSPYDQALFAVTAARDRIQVCAIDSLLAGTPSCVSVPLDGLLLHDGELAFGIGREESQGSCAQVDGQSYQCFADAKPFSIAMSHVVPNSFMVVYSATDGGHSSIYFSFSSGGDLATVDWSLPVRVHSRGSGNTDNYFDAEVTVDRRDRVIVTYSALASPPNHGLVETFRAHQDLHSHEMEVELLDDQWHTLGLPFDCVTQRWALGDYRDPDTLGGRSLHPVRISTNDVVRYDSQWLNESLVR